MGGLAVQIPPQRDKNNLKTFLSAVIPPSEQHRDKLRINFGLCAPGVATHGVSPPCQPTAPASHCNDHLLTQLLISSLTITTADKADNGQE